MPPINHAILSASSAHRWLECPPLAMLEKDIPEETSIYAEEGSAAHEVAEYKVRWYLGEKDLTPPSTGNFDWHRQDGRTAGGWLLRSKSAEHEEIDRHTDTYAYYVSDKIETIRKSCPDAIVLVEQRLDFSNYVEGGFGTGDLVIVADDVIQVIDFKYGQGVAVSAENNPQMMLYALGALNLYDYFYDVKTVQTAIKDDLISGSNGSNAYGFTYGKDGILKFTVFAGDDEVYKYQLKLIRDESALAPSVGSADKDFNVTGVLKADGTDLKDNVYVIPYSEDTYYSDGYQTLLINDENADLTALKPKVDISKNAKIYFNSVIEELDKKEGYTYQESGTLPVHDFSNGTLQFAVTPENSSSDKNYMVSVVKKTSDAKLFVNGPDKRVIYINSYYKNYHDIFIANIGGKELKDINVTLENAKNIKLSVFNEMVDNMSETIAFVNTTIQALLDTASVDKKIDSAKRVSDKKLTEWQDYVKLSMKTAIEPEEYNRRLDELKAAYESAKAIQTQYEQEKADKIERSKRCRIFIDRIKNQDRLQEFDEALFGSVIEKIMVFRDKLVFEFKDGGMREYML